MDIGFPAKVADITAAWLTRALQPRFPGVEVQRVDIGRVINGAATKVRLLLEYNEQGHEYHLPPTLWVKVGFEQHSAQSAPIYALETRFYSQLSESLNLGCAKVFAARISTDGRQSFLLLEDMLAHNAIFYDANRLLTSEQAKSVLTLFARLHGRFWTAPDANIIDERLAVHDWLKPGGVLVEQGIIDGLLTEENWRAAFALPRSHHATGWLRDRETVADIMRRAVHRNRQQAHCLVHGDAHVGNLCLTGDRQFNLMDWQTLMRGFWAHDIAAFLITALSTADRREHEQALLQFYLQELATQGVSDLSFEQAWLDYRRHAIYAFNWVLCPLVWQPESICEPAARRACAAILELDTLSAWSY